MRVKKIISKSKDGQRMEVIAEDAEGKLQTLHLQRCGGEWIGLVPNNKGEKIPEIVNLS